jgi:c-di-GMP-binding flagellar brake protein YcgR
MERKRLPDLESRRYPRLKDNILIFGNLMSSPFKAFTQDISVGGLMFESERNISKERQLEIEIYQPADPHKHMIFSIAVLAKIIWVKKIVKENFEPGENKYRIGMEFSKIKDEDRHRIAEYIENNLSGT